MDWTITLVVIGAGAVLTAFSAWKSGRPRKDSLKPKWVSWRFLTLVFGALMLIGLAHAASLAGFNQGGNRPYP